MNAPFAFVGLEKRKVYIIQPGLIQRRDFLTRASVERDYFFAETRRVFAKCDLSRSPAFRIHSGRMRTDGLTEVEKFRRQFSAQFWDTRPFRPVHNLQLPARVGVAGKQIINRGHAQLLYGDAS